MSSCVFRDVQYRMGHWSGRRQITLSDLWEQHQCSFSILLQHTVSLFFIFIHCKIYLNESFWYLENNIQHPPLLTGLYNLFSDTFGLLPAVIWSFRRYQWGWRRVYKADIPLHTGSLTQTHLHTASAPWHWGPDQTWPAAMEISLIMVHPCSSVELLSGIIWHWQTFCVSVCKSFYYFPCLHVSYLILKHAFNQSHWTEMDQLWVCCCHTAW